MTGRPHVVEIHTNIKHGARAVIGLHTVIVGPPRTGKTTIVNAIEAAGSGAVSDVAGRALLAKDTELATLGDDDSIFSSLVLSDGQTCLWKLSKGHRAQRSGPAIAFPLRDVREAILGSPDKARRWILEHSRPFAWLDVIRLVPESLMARFRRVVPEDSPAGEPADRLAAAIDDVKVRVRDAHARAKARPEPPSGPPPTDMEIREAEAAVARLAAVPSPARLDAVRAELLGRRARIERLELEMGQHQKALDELPPPQPVPELIRSALAVIEHLAHAGAPQCLICGSVVDPAAMRERATHARAVIDDNLRADNRRREINLAIVRLRDQIAVERQGLAGPAEEEKRLAAARGDAAALGDPDKARAFVTELHTRRAQWEIVRRSEIDALHAEQEALAWQQLADALSAALGQLVDRARRQFERAVQTFLPPSYRFGVDLLDGDRQVLRIGLRPPSEQVPEQPEVEKPVRSALSGVEWATVTAALAIATIPPDGPAVIVPEDRAHSPQTLTETMRAFGEYATAQVIITSPVEPSVEVPGWTIVRTVEKPRLPPVVRPTGPAAPPAPAPAPASAPPITPGVPHRRPGPGRPSNASRRSAFAAAAARAQEFAQSVRAPKGPPPPPPEADPAAHVVSLSDLVPEEKP